MIISIMIGIIVLSIIILAHELGHFISAKATGVRVEEFGLGYPPRLVSFKWGETRYSLNAIPFGGFNKLTGEEDPKEPRGLASKKIGTRLLVISAGSMMNFLLAFLLFSTIFLFPQDAEIGQVVVQEVTPDSPAALADIRAGDIILSVNGKSVNSGSELNDYIQSNLGKETAIIIQHRDATSETVQVVPRSQPPEGQGATGIVIRVLNPAYPFWKAIPLGAARLVEILILWVDGLLSMFTGEVAAQFLGPVGLAQLTGEVAKVGFTPLLEVAALISLILSIMNLFPLPAIDGGRIAFVLLEWIRRGKRISPKTEGLVHLIGFIMLMVFMVAITYQDIIRIIGGESIIP